MGDKMNDDFWPVRLPLCVCVAWFACAMVHARDTRAPESQAAGNKRFGSAPSAPRREDRVRFASGGAAWDAWALIIALIISAPKRRAWEWGAA